MGKVDTVVAAYAVLASGSDGKEFDAGRSPNPSNLKSIVFEFVFEDKVVSFGVAADLWFGDVARALRDLVPKHYGEPVSIDCIQTN